MVSITLVNCFCSRTSVCPLETTGRNAIHENYVSVNTVLRATILSIQYDRYTFTVFPQTIFHISPIQGQQTSPIQDSFKAVKSNSSAKNENSWKLSVRRFSSAKEDIWKIFGRDCFFPDSLKMSKAKYATIQKFGVRKIIYCIYYLFERN